MFCNECLAAATEGRKLLRRKWRQAEALKFEPEMLGTVALGAEVLAERPRPPREGERMADYLEAIGGRRAACRTCGAAVWWVVLRGGTEAPYTETFRNHLGDCPRCGAFRRPRV